MFSGLSLDQAPPFQAPLKFFLTAPLFALIGSLMVLFGDPFTHQTPQTIGVVHLFTIGFMVMVIFGALQQMLPVVAGAVIPKPLFVANITYALLVFGLSFFVLGFYLYLPILFSLSGIFLFLGLSFFTSIALYQLLKVQSKSIIVQGIITSLLFFIAAFLLGLHLEFSHAFGNIGASHQLLSQYHYSFVAIGFVFLLIVSITFQVIPMFWVTKPFHKKAQYFILYGTTVCVLFLPNHPLLFILPLVFALYTLKILFTRKRKLQDISIHYYFVSMISLVLCSFFFLLQDFLNLPIEIGGILFGLGFVGSVMIGMLYKIIPFLTWFHLNAKGNFDIPTMRDMIPIIHIKRQFYLYLSALGIMVCGIILQSGVALKGGVFLLCVAFLYLFLNLWKVAKFYLSYT